MVGTIDRVSHLLVEGLNEGVDTRESISVLRYAATLDGLEEVDRTATGSNPQSDLALIDRPHGADRQVGTGCQNKLCQRPTRDLPAPEKINSMPFECLPFNRHPGPTPIKISKVE